MQSPRFAGNPQCDVGGKFGKQTQLAKNRKADATPTVTSVIRW
jgi:hypothetical protein